MEDEGDTEQKLIEKQMDETRASLSNKLEALESQVAETVQTATDVVKDTKEAVAETVESVKETVGEISDKVSDTARSVAHAFDLSSQVQERPWLVFGGAIGLGCLIGWYLPGRPRQATPSRGPRRSFAAATPAAAAYEPAAAPPEAKKPGWVSSQISRLRGLAIGTVMGAVRDLARESLPEAIRERVAEEVDNLTPHLGGEVIHGQVLPESLLHPESKPEEEHNGAGGQAPSSQPAEGEKVRDRSLAGGWN